MCARWFGIRISVASQRVLATFAVLVTAFMALPALAATTNGPVLHLDYGHGEADGCSVAEFMYFVPLISPDPVSLTKSSGNTQRARILSLTRHETGKSFLVTCEVEFVGSGFQRNIFDHAREIQRHERQLKAGKSLDKQLAFISVEGTGRLKIEVEGTTSAQAPTVNEVRVRFNAHGQASPINIGLQDFRYIGGKVQSCNELVARVNALTFTRKPGPPKMDVSVASVKRADAGDNLWQNFMGSLKGTAVNLLIEPLTVERAGHDAMLDFGLALASQARTFQFPLAKNLKVEP